MKYQFYTADVFTDTIFGGNPLAVFPKAEGLSAGQMQAVAAELNLSETAFVHPPEDPRNTCRLRIFTPKTELPFAGHPTVGTAHILSEIGEIRLKDDYTSVIFEEGVGELLVTIRASDGKPTSAQFSSAVMPDFGPAPPSLSDLAEILSLGVGDIMNDTYKPRTVSCGVPFLIVPLASRDALRRARIDLTKWDVLLSDFWAPNVYIFAVGGEAGGPDYRARMFAPAMGINEDPATGAAATALVGYLGDREVSENKHMHWTISQGVELGRPSMLEVEADKKDGSVVAIRVGGKSVLVSEGVMEIPD